MGGTANSGDDHGHSAIQDVHHAAHEVHTAVHLAMAAPEALEAAKPAVVHAVIHAAEHDVKAVAAAARVAPKLGNALAKLTGNLLKQVPLVGVAASGLMAAANVAAATEAYNNDEISAVKLAAITAGGVAATAGSTFGFLTDNLASESIRAGHTEMGIPDHLKQSTLRSSINDLATAIMGPKAAEDPVFALLDALPSEKKPGMSAEMAALVDAKQPLVDANAALVAAQQSTNPQAIIAARAAVQRAEDQFGQKYEMATATTNVTTLIADAQKFGQPPTTMIAEAAPAVAPAVEQPIVVMASAAPAPQAPVAEIASAAPAAPVPEQQVAANVPPPPAGLSADILQQVASLGGALANSNGISGMAQSNAAQQQDQNIGRG